MKKRYICPLTGAHFNFFAISKQLAFVGRERRDREKLMCKSGEKEVESDSGNEIDELVLAEVKENVREDLAPQTNSPRKKRTVQKSEYKRHPTLSVEVPVPYIEKVKELDEEILSSPKVFGKID